MMGLSSLLLLASTLAWTSSAAVIAHLDDNAASTLHRSAVVGAHGTLMRSANTKFTDDAQHTLGDDDDDAAATGDGDGAANPDAKFADNSTNDPGHQVAVPTSLVLPAGAPSKAIEISDTDGMSKAFVIEFKVKFANFSKNNQALITTDEHSFEIEALGPKFAGDQDKIRAWIRTDSGEGPGGKGVDGSDGVGRLLSQKLSPGQWYDVKFQKTHNSVALVVNGQKVESTVNEVRDHIKLNKGEFDMYKGSSKIKVGLLAGSGDMAIDGDLGDITVQEGPPPTTAAPVVEDVPETETTAAPAAI